MSDENEKPVLSPEEEALRYAVMPRAEAFGRQCQALISDHLVNTGELRIAVPLSFSRDVTDGAMVMGLPVERADIPAPVVRLRAGHRCIRCRPRTRPLPYPYTLGEIS